MPRAFFSFLLSLSALSFAWGQDAARVVSDGIPFEGELAGLPLEKRLDAAWVASSAERALEAGLYELAYSLAEQAESKLEGRSVDIGNRLVLIDASLAEANWIEAAELIAALSDLEGAPEVALGLRRAMIAFAEDNAETVGEILQATDPGELEEGDSAWYWFLTGWTQSRRGDRSSGVSFARAQELAADRSPALRAQIGYLVFRSMLAARVQGVDTIAQLQNAVLENEGREVAYAYAQQLAVLLFDDGRVDESLELIGASLESIPPALELERAQFQLLAVMAAGLERNLGRQALNDLLFADRFPDLMSIALQQVFSLARLEEGVGSEALEEALDQLIALPEQHSLLDQALYYRAVFKFLRRDFLAAEEDAAVLQELFPQSPYRRGMLALQASSAWNRNRYRTAASLLQQMRVEFADLRADSRLAALVADCYLRAGLQSNTRVDYRNAAEAYETALSEVTDVSQGGPLFFQLVLARLEAGQLDRAIAAIDDPRLTALAGGEMVWRAEWMVLKEMRGKLLVSDAYERVQESVALAASEPLLRLRLLWLAAKLSVEAGEPEDAEGWVGLVHDLASGPEAAEIDGDLLRRVQASSLLALAEAHFALEEPEKAVPLLEELRERYAGSESALFSYISQARYFESINRTVEAQQLLVSLADSFPENRLAPVALFEAARNAERRGQDAYLDQATQLLDRIATDYPDSEVVYYARLMQADLLRKLNKFGSAEQIYEFLENEYSDHRDRFLAQISLADTLIAQAGENPRKFEAAVSRLELLMDLPEAPHELRVEAGYKLGQAWRSRGETLKAKQIFWVFYDMSLVESRRVALMSRKGRYWLARSLFALAEISKEEGEVEKANDFYREIVDKRLWGADLALTRIESLGSAFAN